MTVPVLQNYEKKNKQTNVLTYTDIRYHANVTMPLLLRQQYDVELFELSFG